MDEHATAGYAALAKGLYLEGLAYDADRNTVWYSDVIAGGIHGVTPDGAKVATFNPDRMWTGGILLNADGAVLSSGAGGIMWNHPENNTSGWLVREINGQPINGINEMTPDGIGGIYFGTVDLERIAKGEPTRAASIYRLTVSGEVILMVDDLGFTNGMMLSLDGTQLFYNNTFDGTYVFDVSPDHALSNRRIFLKKEDCDGMALGMDGTLWITGYTSSGISRMDTKGRVLTDWPTPGGAVTQIRFGGTDMCDVYLTSVAADAGESLKVGDAPDEKQSILYRGRSGVPGRAIEPTRFVLTGGTR